MANGDNTQDQDYNKKKLNTKKFSPHEEQILRGRQRDYEIEEVNPDSELITVDETGTERLVDEAVTDPTSEADEGFCDFLEFNPFSKEASPDELKAIIGLKDCKNLPENLKDKKDINVSIDPSAGKFEGKERLKIEIRNQDTKSCAFIESIRVIVGTSDSATRDGKQFPDIVGNAPNLEESDMLSFMESKNIIVTEQTPTSLIDGVTTNIPECLASSGDKIGILLGPDAENQFTLGQTFAVGGNLPPGADNLIGIMGATGGPEDTGTSVHLHAEWRSKKWTKQEFINFYKKAYPKADGQDGKCVKQSVPPRITVEDMLKFLTVDFTPAQQQIAGVSGIKRSVKADFPDADGLNAYGSLRGWNADGSKGCRHHYAIDVSGKGNHEVTYNGNAYLRVFANDGIQVTFKGPGGKTTGNYVYLTNPSTGESIMVLHFAALWDKEKRAYYTYANNPAVTLKEKTKTAGWAGPKKTYLTPETLGG